MGLAKVNVGFFSDASAKSDISDFAWSFSPFRLIHSEQSCD